LHKGAGHFDDNHKLLFPVQSLTADVQAFTFKHIHTFKICWTTLYSFLKIMSAPSTTSPNP
jgi:hypothetical protein